MRACYGGLHESNPFRQDPMFWKNGSEMFSMEPKNKIHLTHSLLQTPSSCPYSSPSSFGVCCRQIYPQKMALVSRSWSSIVGLLACSLSLNKTLAKFTPRCRCRRSESRRSATRRRLKDTSGRQTLRSEAADCLSHYCHILWRSPHSLSAVSSFCSSRCFGIPV